MNFLTKNHEHKKNNEIFESKILKNLFLIFCVTLISFSCSSDDDASGDSETTAQNKANIIGSWRFTSSTTNGVADIIEECELMDTSVFTSSQVTFTYFEGVDCADTGSGTLNYSIDGNTITVTVDGESYASKIITLNSTTLTIEETETNEDTGVNDIYTDTYTKQ